MPLTKVLNKTKTKSGTHSHYSGEFGGVRKPKKEIEKGPGRAPAAQKDVKGRIGRAEHYAGVARKAAEAHGKAKTDAERTEHEATIAHAAARTGVHAKAVVKAAPGSEEADKATLHAHVASTIHKKLQSGSSEKIKAEAAEHKKNTNDAKAHAEKAAESAAAAKKSEEVATAARASAEAEQASVHANAATTADSWREAHSKARDAHDAAAAENYTAGNTSAAETHEAKSLAHHNIRNKGPQIAVGSESGTAKPDEARHHVDNSIREMKLHEQAVSDGDYEKAREHLDNALGHSKKVESLTSASHSSREDSSAKFSKGTPERAAYLAPLQAQDRWSDKISNKNKPPEQGALKAAEYDSMADKFSAGLSKDQKFAIRNYTDHTDRILNPLLRSTAGKPDASAKLYEGVHAPDDVHKDRLAKRDSEQTSDTSVRREVHDLDAAIDSFRSDRDAKVYRTMSDPDGKILGGLTVGSAFTDHAYVSTTSNQNFLKDFYDNSGLAISGKPNRPQDRVDVHVQVRKGHAVAPLANEAAGFKADEQEMLLPRGSRFRVTKIVEASGDQPKQVHVDLEQD